MISQKQVEECLKEEIVSKALEFIKVDLECSKCLPPDEIPPDAYTNPRTFLLSCIERKLGDLYDDAQKVAKVDLSVLREV